MKALPPQHVMYEALINRDSTFEGLFFVGVKTTGIFCRPTCPARKPKPENVVYFSKSEEALYAGFRACQRCHPLERTPQTPELIQRLSEMVESSPGKRITDWNLQEMGIDPSTARRQFKRHYGMTFQAYQRARRMGLAFSDLREGESVIGTQLNQGFESASGFWEAFQKVFGVPPSKANGTHCMLVKRIVTPLGPMIAMADEEGIHLLEFIDRKGLETEIKWLQKKTKAVMVPGENDHLKLLTEALEDYFEGKKLTFSLPLITHGTAFEESAWDQLQRIKVGETISYGELAKRLDNPKAVRAVARANGKNCLAIVIPCHRVIGADGSLTGYAGGLWRKQWLIDHEKGNY